MEPTLAGQPSMEFVTAAMTKLGSVDIFGQGMGNQGGMLPSQSVKLAHLVLRTKEAPVKVRHAPFKGLETLMCLLSSALELRDCRCLSLTNIQMCFSRHAEGNNVLDEGSGSQMIEPGDECKVFICLLAGLPQ